MLDCPDVEVLHQELTVHPEVFLRKGRYFTSVTVCGSLRFGELVFHFVREFKVPLSRRSRAKPSSLMSV